MKKNSGQALVEFVIILPIILVILLYIIEFGKITLKKSELESNMELITELYKDKKTDELNNFVNSNNIIISYSKNNNLTTITIKKNIKTNMPLINKILGNNIETRRTIYEQ
ncbi:MAG: TadE/TadG family type IV pilus assembly protein [Bacilli bacterium]